MGDLLVGIDIGGTKIATSAGDAAGRVMARTRRPTGGSGDPRRDVALLVEDVRGVQKTALGKETPGENKPPWWPQLHKLSRDRYKLGKLLRWHRAPPASNRR